MRQAQRPRDWEGPASDGHVFRAGELDLSHKVILYLDDISVSFDGFKALNKLNLDDRRRRAALHHRAQRRRQDHHDGRHHRQDAARRGQVLLRPDHRPDPHDRAEIAHAGIGRKFQKPTIFEHHTAFENLELAMKMDKRVWKSLFAALSDDERDRVSDVLRQIRLDQEAERPAGLLSHGQKQWLEIGMLLMQEPRLLLLDEPVAGMTDDETERTAELS